MSARRISGRGRAVVLATLMVTSSWSWLQANAAEDVYVATAVGLGDGFEGDGGPAVDAGLDGPRMIAFDGEGGYYIADTYHHVIRHVDADGIITTFAGIPHGAGFRDGHVDEAMFNAPHSVDVDAAGNVIVGDPMNNRIRKIDPRTKMVTTIAGNGDRGYGGDGGPAVEATLHDSKIAIVGPDEAIYVADMGTLRIRRIDPFSGRIDTWAGNGERASTGDGGDARQAALQPRNIAFDVDNDLLVADRAGNRVRVIDWETRVITALAGNGDAGGDGDEGPALEAEFDEVRGLGVDWMGNVYLADSNNNRIRRVDVDTGIITTVAGVPGEKGRKDGPTSCGPSSPEDCEAALLTNPRHVIFDDAGNMYITDTGTNRIRKIADFISPKPAPSTTTTTTTTAPPDPGAGPGGGSTPPPQGQPGAVSRSGYWMLGADGLVFAFGDAREHGRGGPGAVDVEPTPSGDGYWIVNGRGEVSMHGDAGHFGNVDRSRLVAGEEVTSLSATPSGGGYWVFTNRGRALAFGDAVHFGDMSAVTLNGPVLDSIPTSSGDGYYMVAADGGIFSFGDARFHGSMGGVPLNEPVQSLVPDPDGVGYWLVASDGGVFAFEAGFRGSMGATPLNRPVSGMVAFGDGYLMVGEDGGIFNFSDRPFLGSLGDNPPPHPIVAVAALD